MEFPPAVSNLLKIILKLSQTKKIKLYLVGGYLRDALLQREKDNPDIDFCLKKGAINFARNLAREIRAGFVVLDKEHGCARLVKKIKDKTYTLDFTDFRGKTLEDDLKHRDFTINALAVELGESLRDNRLEELLIDPYQGREDLKARIIRLVNEKAFDEDPLRLLRAFSLAATLGFKIDKDTLRGVKLKARRLSGVSFERIRDELYKILERPDSFIYILQLDKLKLLRIIIPEIEVMRKLRQGPYHHLDVWGHTLETLRQLELLITELKNNRQVQDYLDEFISVNRRRRTIIKLGALLHDTGKPAALRREDGKTKFHGHERIGRDITRAVAQRLKLSNDELSSLEKMVLWHLRPGYLADNQSLTSRAIFRYFRDTGNEAASILLISLADQRSTRGPLTSRKSRLQHEKVALDLLKEYFKRKKEKKPARLVSGDDLIRNFKLEPSPLIGKILREIEELQAIGKIKTKKEALKLARKFIK
ncbi:MAG: HD domain-containing protein [Candidatus Omnitrophica bacterium]|nr:HD domain-containing protein [Candidatus Omnitrophota bacterium]MDD5592701.1 HD domain-containing protein [Candidatus Omnitrophota bacterium]